MKSGVRFEEDEEMSVRDTISEANELSLYRQRIQQFVVTSTPTCFVLRFSILTLEKIGGDRARIVGERGMPACDRGRPSLEEKSQGETLTTTVKGSSDFSEKLLHFHNLSSTTSENLCNGNIFHYLRNLCNDNVLGLILFCNIGLCV